MNDDEDVIDAAASEFLDQEANLAEALESGTETISDNVMDALYNEQCSGNFRCISLARAFIDPESKISENLKYFWDTSREVKNVEIRIMS